MSDKHGRGGARNGAGRKPEGKIQVSYKRAPDVVLFLRSNEKPASQLIENAVRNYYGKFTERARYPHVDRFAGKYLANQGGDNDH